VASNICQALAFGKPTKAATEAAAAEERERRSIKPEADTEMYDTDKEEGSGDEGGDEDGEGSAGSEDGMDVEDMGGSGKQTKEKPEMVRPGTYCPPRLRMPFSSMNEGSKCVSMAWRAMPAGPMC
jgi:hypothetical protein